MTEWLDQPTRAAQLAAWTKLKPDEFAPLYQRIDAAAAAEHWSILAIGKNPILKACQEAERVGFLRELAHRVADAEASKRRKAGDIDAMLYVLGNQAVTQGIVDPRLGMPGQSMLLAIGNAMRACAKIKVADQPAGTGFLVGPDLLLTAGHVVLDTAQENGRAVFDRTLKPDLRFFFARDGVTYDQEVPPAPPGRDPVVMAVPYATPPDQLEVRLSGASAQALDFALVRLARQVNDITPIDIQSPPAPRTEAVWVIGFPGGGEVKWPGATIEAFDSAAARIFHKANTDGGMSGGCCLGPDGRPVGLHEGTLPLLDENLKPREENGRKLIMNRAVALTAIRARLAAERSDPLTQRTRSPGMAFRDRRTLERWRKEARRLAGASLDAWDKAVQDRLGLSPTDPDLPAFHPWFTRKALETWIEEAAAKPGERVRYVNGPAGAGKSFTARILAEKRDERDVIVVDPTVITNWDWEDALSRIGDKGPGEIFRTMIGELRHKTIPAIVDKLGAERQAEHPLFVAIDFERDAAGASRLRFENSPWLSFIVELAGRPWARLLLIGLSDAERANLDDLFAADPAAKSVRSDDFNLDHADSDDIKAFLKAAFEAQGQTVGRTDLAKIVADWEQAGFHQQSPDMQTVEAVLFAMDRTRPLWAAAQPLPPAAGGQGG